MHQHKTDLWINSGVYHRGDPYPQYYFEPVQKLLTYAGEANAYKGIASSNEQLKEQIDLHMQDSSVSQFKYFYFELKPMSPYK